MCVASLVYPSLSDQQGAYGQEGRADRQEDVYMDRVGDVVLCVYIVYLPMAWTRGW